MSKNKFSNLKRGKCHKCNKIKSRTNPLAICHECKKRFCYDHIYSGQINSTMPNNERIRDVCSKCKEKYNYKSL